MSPSLDVSHCDSTTGEPPSPLTVVRVCPILHVVKVRLKRERWRCGRAIMAASLLLVAQPGLGAELIWNAPPSCSSDAFIQRLQDSAEKPITAVSVPQIAIVVRQTTASTTPWQLEMSFIDPSKAAHATRILVGVSCEDVSRAAAVAVAMALHEEVIDAPPVQASTVTDEPITSVQQSTEDSAGQAAAALPTVTVWRIPLQALLSIDGAIQGSPSLGAGLGVGLATGQVFVGVRGVYLMPVTLGDQIAIEIHSALLMVDACIDAGTNRARPRLCVGYEGGAVMGRGTGTGLAVHRKQAAIWHAIKPEVGLFVEMDADLFFSFMVAGAVALTDATFVFDEGQTAHDLPRFSLRGNVGLGWAF